VILNPWYWVVFAVAVAGFWIAPVRARHAVLGAVCLGWWAWVSVRLAAVVLAWTLLVYLVAPRVRPGRPRRRAWFWSAVALLLALLAAAKALHGAPAPEGASWLEAHALFTLGVSYYTLKFIHVLTEAARGTLPGLSLPRFVSYSLLMPTFTAGPIERYDHYLESAPDGRPCAADWLEGLERIAVGLVKKALPVAWLGAFLFTPDGAPRAASVLNAPHMSPLFFWTHAGAMFLYVYLDFSAYSDIAIGSARLLGIRVVENFNFPLLARNLPDFWRRWHISLGAWCRSYVYMPVLGATRNPVLAGLRIAGRVRPVACRDGVAAGLGPVPGHRGGGVHGLDAVAPPARADTSSPGGRGRAAHRGTRLCIALADREHGIPACRMRGSRA
jgi:alginate O-acetyltransferase complex protein AlgI